MKIAVQGKIIDTENIYYITESSNFYSDEKKKNVFGFEIVSFNDNRIEVSQSPIEGFYEILRDKGFPEKDFPIDENLREEKSKIYNEVIAKNKEKIERMRIDIVNIWSQNQSKIPNFDIKNY